MKEPKELFSLVLREIKDFKKILQIKKIFEEVKSIFNSDITKSKYDFLILKLNYTDPLINIGGIKFILKKSFNIFGQTYKELDIIIIILDKNMNDILNKNIELPYDFPIIDNYYYDSYYDTINKKIDTKNRLINWIKKFLDNIPLSNLILKSKLEIKNKYLKLQKIIMIKLIEKNAINFIDKIYYDDKHGNCIIVKFKDSFLDIGALRIISDYQVGINFDPVIEASLRGKNLNKIVYYFGYDFFKPFKSINQLVKEIIYISNNLD
jgi:hypothetical protein